MSRRRSIALLLAVTLGVVIAQPAGAASPRETLEAFFRGTNAILRSTEAQGGTEAPRQAIHSLVNEIFDYRDAATRALGPAWQSRTPSQQAEFVRLFSDILGRGYIAFIGAKANVSDGLQVLYLEERIDGDSAAVATTLLTRSGPDLGIDYLMVLRGGRWMVRDVVLDGMSLIANYRAQFTRFLSTSSYADLVARMQGATVATAAAPQPTKPASPSAVVIPGAIAPPVARQEDQPAARLAEVTAPRVETARVSATEPAIPVQAAPKGASRVAASHYWIQVGAFRTVGAAGQLAERLRRQGVAALNDPLTSVPGHPAGALSRVRVGPFATHADAQSKLRELVERGYAPFIAEARD